MNKFLTRQEQLVLLLIAIAILAGAVVVWKDRARTVLFKEPLAEPTKAVTAGKSVAAVTPTQPGSPPVPTPPTLISVDVDGAVNHPGVYRLPLGSIVADAIRAAGGTTEEADLIQVNRAARLEDGTKLVVPLKGKTPETAPVVGSQGYSAQPNRQPISGGKININTASAEQLATLPGIGEVKAKEIVAYRQKSPFRTLQDLVKVKGIGPKTFEALKDRITVGP